MGPANEDLSTVVQAPQDERDLVAQLAPESPLLFARARRLLQDLSGDAVARFKVGRLGTGCWTVLQGEDGWRAVRWEGDSYSDLASRDTARATVAYAVGALLAEEGSGLNSEVFRLAGLIREGEHDEAKGWREWELTETGQRIWTETENAPRPSSDRLYVALGTLLGRHGCVYFVSAPGKAPAHGPFVSVRQVFEMLAFNALPEAPGEPSELLPAGKVLDGYGDTDQVFLYEVGTPFNKRALWGEPERHRHRFYRLQEPLRVHPGFPVEHTTVSVEQATEDGRGYYLVNTIAELVASGRLRETAAPEATP
ncbi:glycohydrolase toxin TNT-related protein [Actinomadura rubrisoli]|uniref:DUF4237 domain-containing protein n=1 Tax=Actinomadura rubrisoli TaxID=2530368 RepID=A0A4R4ZYW4_9ACTN|nr:glycohydrolase toxin TNT-related protein [Actinomadura rubrisoli]TDD64481.1 DUF4237 domain-containing protein [Actinomadura rubrisoli]